MTQYCPLLAPHIRLPRRSDGFYVLESADEVITDQKVVVIKPDPIDGVTIHPQ
jgi:hypothetical protein